jgi:transcription antitermination factor NusG
MGGRGSSSAGGKSATGSTRTKSVSVSVGQKVTVKHGAFGNVTGTVSKVLGSGTFRLKNPKSDSGKTVKNGVSIRNATFHTGGLQ